MRMWDFIIIMVCFELAIGFVNGIALFAHPTYTQSQDSILNTDGYMTGNMNATSKLLGSAQNQNTDYFSMALWAFSGLGMFLNIAWSAVTFGPHLMTMFGCPPILAYTLQILIYMAFVFGIFQILTGRSGPLMQ